MIALALTLAFLAGVAFTLGAAELAGRWLMPGDDEDFLFGDGGPRPSPAVLPSGDGSETAPMPPSAVAALFSPSGRALPEGGGNEIDVSKRVAAARLPVSAK